MSAKPILSAFCLAIAVLFALTGEAFSKQNLSRGQQWGLDCFLGGGTSCCARKWSRCSRNCAQKFSCQKDCDYAKNTCIDIVTGKDGKYGGDQSLAPVEPKSRRPNAGTFQGTQPQVFTSVQPKVRKSYGGTFQGKQKIQ